MCPTNTTTIRCNENGLSCHMKDIRFISKVNLVRMEEILCKVEDPSCHGIVSFRLAIINDPRETIVFSTEGEITLGHLIYLI